jgi:hypothetical protein
MLWKNKLILIHPINIYLRDYYLKNFITSINIKLLNAIDEPVDAKLAIPAVALAIDPPVSVDACVDWMLFKALSSREK